ncbi:ABC transporter permease [Rhodococcus erythropolis]|uniref:Putative ABC transporter permease protein n=1 Tax=Rhodococcus erythropolis (strain PR4 / NBRC 100887) TaxID=234621 RepID=C0ZQ55_RHOE4|nr:ABC transporter permease [Rhodococcus erythropolis]MCQ4124852.1 ABC transporter permease [Rhodococcus erythropolis]BAH31533.1 putative ABC transporter permease protein [Rhodococcus erythropolis PR4]
MSTNIEEVVTPDRDDAVAAVAKASMLGKKKRQRKSWIQTSSRLGAVVVFLILWSVAAGTLVDTFYLPEPTAVAEEIWDWILDGSLWTNIMATMVPAAQGFLIGGISALVLGYLFAMSKTVSMVLEPFVAAAYGIPVVALVPLLILWLGIGRSLAVGVSAIVVFFLIFYNVYFGIKDVKQEFIDQVRIAGASQWDLVMRVRLPSALVWVVASLKLAVPHALVGVVVAEFLTGSEGLGFMLSSNAAQFNAAGTFASVVVLAAISFALDRIVFMISRRALMWKETAER